MKYFFTLASLAAILTSANAAVVTVTCQNTPAHFLPITVNAVCGDSIHWTWVAGGHVVGPISTADIPGGAAMWNAPIDAAHLSFYYVITVAGNYHYVCHPSTPHGEDAYIVVSCATGVPSVDLNHFSFAYPNPVTDKLYVISYTPAPFASGLYEKCGIAIYNLLGEKIYEQEIRAPKTEINFSSQPSGIYFYCIIKEGVIIERRKFVKLATASTSFGGE